jgi:hypothetical protein
MTQDFSLMILKATDDNERIIKIVSDGFYDDLMNDFKSGRPIMNRYCCITFNRGQYKTVSKDLNTEAEASFESLYQYNFKFGSPLLFVVCRFNIITHDDNGKEQNGVYLTEQTPYKTKRKIFITMKDNQGTPKLMEDGFSSTFAKTDPTIQLYDNLIFRTVQLPN